MNSNKDTYVLRVRNQTQDNFKGSKKIIQLSILLLFAIFIMGTILKITMPKIRFATNKIKSITTQVEDIKEKSSMQAIFENFISGVYY